MEGATYEIEWAVVDVNCRAWLYYTIISVPYDLSTILTMCT
jgi:hypothetical protein